MSKYAKVFWFNLKTQLNFKVDYIASLFSFTIHVIVFYFLWDFILGDKLSKGYSKEQLVWYVIIGELIVYTVTGMYKNVSEMIKTGSISNMLIKPINFIGYIAAQEMTAFVRFGFNCIFAVILGIFMGGRLDLSISNFVLFVLSLTLSLVLLMSLNILIGMLAFITEENRAFNNIISKFVLMVLFTPLEFFSDKIQILLRLLPTTYVVYPSAKILVNFNYTDDIMLIVLQIVSIILVCLALYLVYRKGVKDINVNGG